MERKKKQLSPLEAAVYEDVRLKQIKDTTIEEQLIGNFIGCQGFGYKDCIGIVTADDFADMRMAKLFTICEDLQKRGVEINSCDLLSNFVSLTSKSNLSSFAFTTLPVVICFQILYL